MLNAYKKRLQLYGGNTSNALKQQSNSIMNATFKNSVNYKSVIINNKHVDARYLSHKTTSINGDAVDYLLQFRPHVKYPIGTYVSIPNEEMEYEDWLIVNESYDVMFPKYNILKCNYVIKWIVDKNIYEYKVALRNRGNNVDYQSSSFILLPDSQISIWLPFNQDTKTIHYGTRFLISYNEIYPTCYQVTKVEDAIVKGIIKLSLTQDEVGVNDNVELMIADYYKQFPDTSIIDNEYNYQLLGYDSMLINSESEYVLQVTHNNEIVPINDVVFRVMDINGDATDLVTYTIENNKIRLSSSDKRGNIILYSQANGVVLTKEIKIKGLL